MGKNLVFVTECPSTNSLALEISHQSGVTEGTLIIAAHQTAGKGQRGNAWEAAPGKNLTFSLILRPGFLAITRQFFLNISICLALKDYLTEKLSDGIHIKWPNDILVHEKKISGVLIENQLHGSAIVQSIVGIGFNVNQRDFSTGSATSLSLLTGNVYDLEDELHAMLQHIEGRYLQLRQGNYGLLMDAYLASLFRRNERHTFSSEGNLFGGEILDLDPSGRLRMKVNGEIRSFGIKEFQYV